jgi:hypothetical protein
MPFPISGITGRPQIVRGEAPTRLAKAAASVLFPTPAGPANSTRSGRWIRWLPLSALTGPTRPET